MSAAVGLTIMHEAGCLARGVWVPEGDDERDERCRHDHEEPDRDPGCESECLL